MCRDGFRENCLGCGRVVTCRDDHPYCEDPCWFQGSDEEASKVMASAGRNIPIPTAPPKRVRKL